MNVFCDIDGTLTDKPHSPWGEPNKVRIDILRRLMVDGHDVVLWSANGSDYVEEFAEKYGLFDVKACLGKPDYVIDDKPHLRDEGRITYMKPEDMGRVWAK